MAEASGTRLSAVPATLPGYRRLRVRGEHYPAVVPDADTQVEGVVYLNVPEAAWARLDQFEGEMYSREIVQIRLADSTTIPAETYVFQASFTDCLDDTAWDFTNFLREGKESFRRSYLGYQRSGH